MNNVKGKEGEEERKTGGEGVKVAVLGLDGIRYVLESSKNLPLDFFIMLPSCVPATHLETAGARLTADDLALMIADERVAGVAELMNYPGVYLGQESELAKIRAGKGKAIDGHAPGLKGKNLERLRAGRRAVGPRIHRTGRSGGKAAAGHAPVAARRQHGAKSGHAGAARQCRTTSMNCSFATDDKLAGDLVAEGHIDHCVRKSIKLGMPPITALQIATINTARHYRLRNFGAIAPRFWADFIVFDDLKNIGRAADLQERDCWWRRTGSISARRRKLCRNRAAR